MLSICIPVYNYDVSNLIINLKHQAQTAGINYEILVFDDYSSEYRMQYNNKVYKDINIKTKCLAENVGRSRIRNLLISEAKYEYLLFIDADSEIPVNYISNYYNIIQKINILSNNK